jgi:hypothetical protein
MTTDTSKKFYRSHFLINSKLQLSLVLYFVAIGLAVAIGSYILLYRGFQGYIDEVASGLPGIDKNAVTEVLKDLRSNLLRDFAVSSVSGLVGVFLGGILVSHRIAGPLYRIEQAMKGFVNEGNDSEVHLRKHDYAKSLADLYNQMVKKIKR